MNFLTIDEAWKAIVNRLMMQQSTRESRAGNVKEMMNIVFTIDPQYAWLTNSVRALDPRYAAGELSWYLAGSDRLDHIAAYASQYPRFSDDGQTLNGAYGKRLLLGTPHDAIDALVSHLLLESNSRRAVLPIYRLGDLGRQTNDCPCTLSIQFQVRNNALYATTVMRSNDIWLGLPYDVFCFTMFQRIIASRLALKVGSYTHFVGNMHVYERNFKNVVRALNEDLHAPYELWTRAQQETNTANTDIFVECERQTRLIGVCHSKDRLLWLPLTDMCSLIQGVKPVSPVLAIAQEVRNAHSRRQ